MASKKNTTTTAGAGAAAGTDANDANNASDTNGTAAPKKSNRGGRKPGDLSFAWDGQRDQVLVLTLLQNPGTLTPAQLVAHLSQHPAFAADATLLTAEKIRGRVAKLSAQAEKMGFGKLQLRRTGGGGYDMGGMLASVFKSLGMAPTPVQAAAPAGANVGAGVGVAGSEVQFQAAAPAIATSQVPQQSGGLISLIPTPGQ